MGDSILARGCLPCQEAKALISLHLFTAGRALGAMPGTKNDTLTQKKSFQLNSDFLDLFAKRSLGCGRNFSGGKSQVRTSPIRHLLLRSCVCTCSSGMMPTTAPSTLLRAVLPTGPALTSLFAHTLQIGWENVGRGDGGQLAKDAT